MIKNKKLVLFLNLFGIFSIFSCKKTNGEIAFKEYNFTFNRFSVIEELNINTISTINIYEKRDNYLDNLSTIRFIQQNGLESQHFFKEIKLHIEKYNNYYYLNVEGEATRGLTNDQYKIISPIIHEYYVKNLIIIINLDVTLNLD